MIVLFDFDGVIADTESQYTYFWNKQGKDYLGLENFGHTIKGQTLVQIFDKYFNGMVKEQEEIVPNLNAFEENMSYDYIPGALEFMQELKAKGIRTAIVTSSKRHKDVEGICIPSGAAGACGRCAHQRTFLKIKARP